MTEELVKEQSLWGVLDDVRALFDTREGLDPADPNFAAVSAALEQKLQAQVRKVGGIHKYRAYCRAQQQYCNDMQDRFLKARIEWEKEETDLEEYVIRCMQAWGEKEIVGEGLKIKLKNNPPSVLILDESQIPWDYRETVQPPPVEKIVKAKIAKALKSGIDVPGADLNISSVRLDWGDPPKKKGALDAAAHFAEVENA